MVVIVHMNSIRIIGKLNDALLCIMNNFNAYTGVFTFFLISMTFNLNDCNVHFLMLTLTFHQSQRQLLEEPCCYAFW